MSRVLRMLLLHLTRFGPDLTPMLDTSISISQLKAPLPQSEPSVDKWLMIVNPEAAGGKVALVFERIKAILAKKRIEADFVFTRYAGEGSVIAQEALLKGYQRLVAVGGDGTLHEVADGIMRETGRLTPNFQLAVLPIGTGEDWAKMYGFPKAIEEKIAILQNGRLYLQDVGKVEYVGADGPAERYFINIAGLGFDAKVVDNTGDKPRHGWRGQAIYFLGIFQTLFQYRPRTMRINTQELSRTYQSLSANIGICQYSGGGMRMVPRAISDDGWFDITVIGPLSPGRIIANLPKLYNGNIYKHPEVDYIQASKIYIDGPIPIPIEVDGEWLGYTPATFTLIPQALPILIPQAR